MTSEESSPDAAAAADTPSPNATASEELSRLDRSLARGLAFTGAARWGTQALRWGATIYVARLLTPGDYGIVGMALVYVGFVQLFADFGLSSAIVQSRDLEHDRISRLSGLALLIATGLFLFSTVASIPIAHFFKEPRVAPVIVALGAKFVLDGAALVPRAMLQREMRFARLAGIEGIEATVLAAATLILAAVTRSYWSLVGGVLIAGVVSTILANGARPTPIAWPRDLRSLGSMLRFGRDVVLATLGWYGYSNADFVVVGRMFDAAALGAYTFAWNIASVPVEKIATTANRVGPSIFAAVQHDAAAMRRYYLALSEGIAFLTFPISFGLALVARDLVHVVLGTRWESAILPLTWLALSAGLRSIGNLPAMIMYATGHARMGRNVNLALLVVLPIGFLIASRWGATGVAAAWVIVYPLAVIGLNFQSAFRLISLTWREFLTALSGPIVASLIMAASVLLLNMFLPANTPALVGLLSRTAVGAAVYAALLLKFHKPRMVAFKQLLRPSKPAATA